MSGLLLTALHFSRFNQMRENAHTSSTETWELWVHFQRVWLSLFIGNAFAHRKVIKSRKYSVPTRELNVTAGGDAHQEQTIT
jgi:hypothetical protein